MESAESTASLAAGPNAAALPLVGLIRNPRSHRNKGRSPEMDGAPNVLTEAPHSHAELRAVLARFAARGIDYLAVDGGDGTVRDVLTCGYGIWGNDWPALIALPKGKTNALTVDLGLPNKWSLAEALAAAQGGRRVERQPLLIGPLAGEDEQVLGFLFGTGAFTLAIDAGQEAHRLGAFNSFAVGLTIAWGIVQSLLGGSGNPWRACRPMRFSPAAGIDDLPHGPRGQAGTRYLALATTFERFPLGVLPFGRNPGAGLKICLIDWPARRVMASLPLILLGAFPRFLGRNGAFRSQVERLDVELGTSFILDGEAYPAGRFRMEPGPRLSFVVP